MSPHLENTVYATRFQINSAKDQHTLWLLHCHQGRWRKILSVFAGRNKCNWHLRNTPKNIVYLCSSFISKFFPFLYWIKLYFKNLFQIKYSYENCHLCPFSHKNCYWLVSDYSFIWESEKKKCLEETRATRRSNTPNMGARKCTSVLNSTWEDSDFQRVCSVEDLLGSLGGLFPAFTRR